MAEITFLPKTYDKAEDEMIRHGFSQKDIIWDRIDRNFRHCRTYTETVSGSIGIRDTTLYGCDVPNCETDGYMYEVSDEDADVMLYMPMCNKHAYESLGGLVDY